MVDELAGPLSYGEGWWWALCGLTLLPVALVLGKRLPTWVRQVMNRPRRRATLRAQCLASVAGIERSYEEGQLTARQAHSELSVAVRQFVGQLTGTRTDAMTLVDLQQTDAGEDLLAAVRTFYDGAFAARPSSAVSDSARVARLVVAGWN